MIGSVSYLMHNVINKNFGRLALLYKINRRIQKTISALFQLPDYEDLIKL